MNSNQHCSNAEHNKFVHFETCIPLQFSRKPAAVNSEVNRICFFGTQFVPSSSGIVGSRPKAAKVQVIRRIPLTQY